MMRPRHLVLLVMMVLLVAGCGKKAKKHPKTGKPKPTKDVIALGKKLYGEHCAKCHGDSGKGDGKEGAASVPKPRDFTTGKYKYISNAAGPTDDDLYKVTRDGMPGTPMPAYKSLMNEYESWAVVWYVKELSGLKGKSPEAMKVGAMPENADEKKGQELYSQHCSRCHGDKGLGDGIAADTLKDDKGDKLPVRNLVHDMMRGGSEAQDLFKRVKLGLPGTPMVVPDAYPELSDDDVWALVKYMASLRKK